MTMVDIFLWIVLPYVSITIFIVGHVWRYRHDQFGWTSRSTQLLEGRILPWGSVLFHYGALAAIGGHVLGLLVPASLTAAVGITEEEYHLVSAGAGTLAGLACLAGLVILVARRIAVPRVRVTTSTTDLATYTLLAAMIGIGVFETVGVNTLGGGYDYRGTVSVWFRGIFLLNPQPGLIAAAPFVYQLHAALAWFLFALWPFSRLVHVWSYPIQFLARPNILYRSRYARSYR